MRAVADMPAVVQPPPHQTEERRAEERERLANMSVDAFIGAWQHALEGWEGSESRLGSLDVPTLVICGELDVGLKPACEVLAAKIPGARLEMIAEAGHSPQYERPEIFNRLVRQHLASNAPASAK